MSKKNEHQKYFNSSGIEVPSVTTVLKILNTPQLIPWANYMGFKRKKIKDILDEASYIGTSVHDLIAKILKYKFVNFKKYKDDKAIMNCFHAFNNWKKENQIIPQKIELSLSCEDYGGTLDCLCILNSKSTLLDYKTSSAIHPSMFLQLGGYLRLLAEHKYKVDMAGIVQLSKKTGEYSFICQPVEYLQEYVELFNKLVDVYKKWTYLLKYDWGEEFDT